MHAEDEVIRSRQNPLVKRVGAALAGRERGVLVLQGDRLVDDAVNARAKLECVLVAADRVERARELAARGVDVRLVDAEILAQVSTLTTSPGVLALAREPAEIDLEKLALGAETRILVVAGVADPGNLGALARAAEAFGVAAFVVARGGASPWNEKALRGSMGSLLRVPVCAERDARAIADVLARRNVRQIKAATRGGTDADRYAWRGPLALWIGGETGELPDVARDFEALTIAMAPNVESLNVTVAAAILLHAAARAAREKTRV